MGDIDLVWGNDEIGLKKIIDKHLSDFADFKGDTAQDKLANALGEIVKDGKLINEKGVNTLYFSQGEKVYLVGLSEGFNGVGNNKWIITSYKVENIKPHIKEQIGSANKTLSADESLKEPQAFGSTADTNEIIPNSQKQSQASAKIKDLEKELDETYNAYGHAVMARSPSRDELKLKIHNINDELGKLKFSLNENDLGYIDIKPLLQKQPLAQVKKQIKQGLSEKYQFLDEKFTKGDESFQRQLNEVRKHIETRTNTTPLKEFGTNYAEFYRDGQGAVKKLLAEKQGQVAGAFYRQDLGDITLAWGKSYKDENGEWRGFGLAHILDKHGKEFKDLARELSEVIEKGVLVKESDDKIILKSPQHTIILGKKENNKFVVTGYRQNNAKKLETTQTGGAGSFADETHPRNSLSSNQQEIISNSKGQSQGEKEFLSPNSEDIFAKTTPEQRNQIVKGIQGEIDELVKASYEIDGKIKQIAKVANERAEMTGRYSRTSDEIKAIDALNKESEKLEKEVYKLQTLQNFFKGDLSNDFWEFLHNFNNEKALKWYEKEINKRVKSVSGDEIQKVSHEVSHINQNNAIMSEISHKGGQDGTSNASNGLNAAEKGMPASEPAGISDGLFTQKQLLDEPRGAGADLSNSPTHRQQPQTLFSQGASEPNASGGQQRGSNERLRTASGDLRGEVSGDGQNLRAQQGLNVSERFKQDRSEQHSRAKHTIRANSSSGTSHSNATATQELVSDTNAAGILSPAEKATIENQKFTQTIDPAKFNANEILSANILTKNYDKEHLNELIDAGNDIVRLAQLAKNGNKTAERILQNYHTEAVGRGYSGYSMSVNAVEAQENGVKPLSKFNAKDAKEVSEILNENISTNELKNLLSDFGDTGEWHHTSKFYNKTPHYSIAEMFLNLDKVKNRLALKKNAKDIIEANTQLYNDYISQIDKAAEFVKNAKDIDKSWVLSWFRERKMNAKNYLERENKFGKKAEFDVISEVFKVKTLENHPQFNALFIQQNKENLQNLAKISSENLEKGQDLDLKNKTLQEIMLKNEKIINYAFLRQIADDLPPAFSKDEFIKALAPNAKGRANIKTPIKDIEINAEQAWEHLLDNSKGEDRTKISGGLLQTLKKPFFVTKNDEGSYYFYKPFKDERGILNLISIEVPKAARLKYKTSYIADKNKMLELINKHELVYKSW